MSDQHRQPYGGHGQDRQPYDPAYAPQHHAGHGAAPGAAPGDWQGRHPGALPPEQAGHQAPRHDDAPASSPPPAAPAPAPSEARHRGPYASDEPPNGEGERSPLIAPGIQPAALTAVLGALLAGTAAVGSVPLTVAVALLQAVTAAGWFRLNGMWPARQGIALAFLGGVATDVGLLVTDREAAPDVVIGTLGVWCVLTLVLHLRNRSSPDERLYALTAALTSTALTVIAAGHLVAAPEAVTVGAASVGVAALARALPLPPYVSPVVALLAASGAGVAVGQLTGMGTAGGLAGAVAGGCALIGLRVASYDFPSRFVHLTAGVALPLTCAAPAVYLLGRVLA